MTPFQPMPADTRAALWSRYLADLQDYAALPQPLETSGTLVRVTGLVLEAAGVRVPVGSVCEVRDARPARASRACWPRWWASTATAPS